MLRSKRIHYHAAANRHLRRITAQNKTIAQHADHRGFKPQLGQTGSAGFDLIPVFQDPHAGQYFRRADMGADALSRAKRAWRIREQLHFRVHDLRWK